MWSSSSRCMARASYRLLSIFLSGSYVVTTLTEDTGQSISTGASTMQPLLISTVLTGMLQLLSISAVTIFDAAEVTVTSIFIWLSYCGHDHQRASQNRANVVPFIILQNQIPLISAVFH